MGAPENTIIAVFGAKTAEELPGLSRIGGGARLRFATTVEQLAEIIEGADAMLGWDFRAGALEHAWPRANRLRWVHWAGAGVDAVLFPGLRDSDVVLTNARGVFDRPMAEYVLGLVLCLAKGFPRTVRSQTRRHWDFRLTESIHGRTALLVGVGSIGSAIGGLLKAAGMRVAGVGRNARKNHPVFGDVHSFSELDRQLEGADYVVNITPSTPDTRGLFSSARFRRMKPDSRFINVGRGDAVDEQALAAALRDGVIAGAALDVLAGEPLPETSPLWELENLIISPHMSGDVADSQAELIVQFTTNLERFIRGEPLINVVDKHQGY